jgi:hypothetical protein
MIAIDNSREIPSSVRFHQSVIEEIIQSIQDRVYCAVLGPRLCGKTILLRYIEKNFSKLLGFTCIFINLDELRPTTQQDFFSDLCTQTAQQLKELTGIITEVPEENEANSATFRAFLTECTQALGRDLVLMIDPLEALPTDMVQSLLTSLRAAYMDQQSMDNQVTVIVSGALSLATLTVGESSPFRGIARRIFVNDLSSKESEELILEYLSENNISTTRKSIQLLKLATSGDIFLIRKLTKCCIDLVISHSLKVLRAKDVNYIINRFLRSEVFRYAPLIEAIRLIEDDPDLLECTLKILREISAPRTSLHLPLSPDLDPLYLTGVFERDNQDQYTVQNSIYRRFLIQHFNPGRVGHVLAMTGQWDSAMDYLFTSIQNGNHQSRTDLLSASINSMYAAEDFPQAVRFLQRGLSAAFGVSEAQVWLCPPQENFLKVFGSAEMNNSGNLWSEYEIPINADRLEARAFRQQVTLRGQEGENRIIRAIPLRIPGQRPIGIVDIADTLPLQPSQGINELSSPETGYLSEIGTSTYPVDLRERDRQLVGFLNHAARAIYTVYIRRLELSLAGRVQASLIPTSLPAIPGWQISARWQPARETSGDFYDLFSLPGGRLGIVIADVVDKGMGAALLMTLSRTLLRTFAMIYPDKPDELMKMTNHRIMTDINIGLFVTLFFGVLEPYTGNLIYCNAGQPPPYLFLDDSGEKIIALNRTGMAIGVSEEEKWKTEVIQIPFGGVLLLYTDGALDAQNSQGEIFGHTPLSKLIQNQGTSSAQDLLDFLLNEIYVFAGKEAQVDDITLMVVRRIKEVDRMEKPGFDLLAGTRRKPTKHYYDAS